MSATLPVIPGMFHLPQYEAPDLLGFIVDNLVRVVLVPLYSWCTANAALDLPHCASLLLIPSMTGLTPPLSCLSVGKWYASQHQLPHVQIFTLAHATVLSSAYVACVCSAVMLAKSALRSIEPC